MTEKTPKNSPILRSSILGPPSPILCLLSTVLCLLSSVPATGQVIQTVEISSSPNPVGSGARALGMGGAFIGVADDATAASWNPAGLIQLETPEFSLVGAYNARREDTTYLAFPEASGPQDVATTELNYLSLAYPFEWLGANMVVSLNYQHLFDFNKSVTYRYTAAEPGPPSFTLTNAVDYRQDGALRTLTPAMAVQITPFVSFGLSLNFWNHGLGDNGWNSRYQSRGSGALAGNPVEVEVDVSDEYDLTGTGGDLLDPFHWENVNFAAGLLWELSDKLTVGAVFKSPFVARLDHHQIFAADVVFPAFPDSDVHQVSPSAELVRLEMPMSYGLGLAWRLNDSLTFDLDFYHTEWGDYILEDAADNRMSPITGEPAGQADIGPTTQIRCGGEYLFIGSKFVVPVRAGLFYDPEPAAHSPDDFFGFALGTGLAYRQYVFDLAYQYRFGRDVRNVQVGDAESSQDVDQHTVYASFIYHFW